MKSLLLLYVTVLLVVSDWTYKRDFKAANPTLAPKMLMWTDQTDVFMQDTIWLQFNAPHPALLGIINPGGRFFYIVFPAHEAPKTLIPLADSKLFVHMTCLAIPTSLKADPYQYGITENKPVFTRFGTYTFIMGDNLHTDDPSENHQVTVRYHQKVKPKPPKTASN